MDVGLQVGRHLLPGRSSIQPNARDAPFLTLQEDIFQVRAFSGTLAGV